MGATAARLLLCQCHPPSHPAPALAPTAPGSPHAPTPSPTCERLRHYIAERMRMSHVYQPLMLMELLKTWSCYRNISSPAKMESLAARLAEPMKINKPKS